MLWSENAGIIISKCTYQKTCFYWEIPNYFTYQSEYRTVEQVVPRIVSSPWFLAFNNKWRLALTLNRKRNQAEYVGFFLWMMASSNEAPMIKAKLFINDCFGNEYESCEGYLDLNGHFGSWDFLDLDLFFDAKQKISPSGVLKLVCVMEKEVPISFESPGSYEHLLSKYFSKHSFLFFYK